jgi:4-methylaminobutanoate oxidase (formaldehyde-forming)
VYTPWCDERGGMVADVTVTRLADDRFRVVTGAGYVAADVAWVRSHVEDGERVSIDDVSGAFATIGLWGPLARDVLGPATSDDVSDPALPLRTARTIHVGPAPVLAARLSYAGELGWEMTTEAAWAVEVWDRLWATGAALGLEPFGYRALDSLRMEKGFRYYGTDLTMLETPYEAGLGAFVRLDTGEFVGRAALQAARDAPVDETARRLRTLRIGGSDWLPVYGGEAVRANREVIGRLRSVAYGPTVSTTIGYAYCPATLADGTELEVDVFDERVPATIAADVLVDPEGIRIRR